jgi:hypothetical protein
MNSRGREPTVSEKNKFDPAGVVRFIPRPTVGLHPWLFVFGRFAAKLLGWCPRLHSHRWASPVIGTKRTGSTTVCSRR